MKQTFKILLASFVIVLLLSFVTLPSTITSRKIVDKMNASIGKISSLKFTMKKKERVDGQLLTGEQDVKYNRTPMKVYTMVQSPKKGTEVLFIEGENGNKAFVNPKEFPYVTLTLDPYGDIMRNKNHHTVHEVGFDYINGIIQQMIKNSGADFDKIFSYQGDTIFDGRKCHKIFIDYKDFKYINYTVSKGETLVTIAYKLFISDYMILTLNKEISDYSDVKPGQVIKIPNAYARKTFLCIDIETGLPLLQRMYDEKGLFSEYAFYNLKLNPSIAKEEFTKEYKDYGF